MAKKQGDTKKKSSKKKDTKSESKKEKSLRKRFLPLFSIIIIICIIGLIWFTLNPQVGAEEAKAQLIIDYGTVEIKHTGELWTFAENGMYLYQSDSVKTGDNTSASIILFESSIIRLASNTELTIQELIRQEEETSVTIGQASGRTWNTISKMSGIDDYEVQTPTTVASVRGTSFDVYILANGNISISVGNGTVNITTYKDGEVLYSLEVPEYLSITVDPNNPDIIPDPKPYEEDDWILGNQQKDEELIGDLKDEIYKRLEPFLPEVRDLFGGPSDEELYALIEGYVLGYWTLPADSPDWVKKLFEFA